MSMRRFSQVIDELELKDIPLRGGGGGGRARFAWSWGLDNQRMEILDRFIVTDGWDLFFGGVI